MSFYSLNRSLNLLPLSKCLTAWKADPKDRIFIYHRKLTSSRQQQSLHRKVGTKIFIKNFNLFDKKKIFEIIFSSGFFWIKNEQAQIVLEVENYLPARIIINQLEFLTENQLVTNLDTKYEIPSRTTERLVIDCIPKEIGQLRIEGFDH